MRVVIIDDETAVRKSATTLLSIYCPEVEVVGEADGVEKGIDVLQKEKPDLVLLDVEMPDGTGFDIVNALPDRKFAVVFITGHNGYAIRAFKLSAIDYLLKPIDPEELQTAISKAKDNLKLKALSLHTKTLEYNLSKNKGDKIVLKDGAKVYLVDVVDIMHCQSEDNYTHFFLSDNRQIMVSTTLKEYERILGETFFFRSHQSHLVNLNFVDYFDKSEGGKLILKNETKVPVSFRKKEILLKKLQQL